MDAKLARQAVPPISILRAHLYSDTLRDMGGMPMSIAIRHMKLVVRDLDAAECFYRAIGLKVLSRNIGGEDGGGAGAMLAL